MAAVDPEILAYYEQGKEASRLHGGFPSGPLEFQRTRELIARHLPRRPLRILDVGGGPGAYASWLAQQGHQVRLIDPVPLHARQAAAADQRISAELGDARHLACRSESADVVLLLGPLYHLSSSSDRRTALEEANRVLRPGGLLFASAISRFAALLDMLVRLDVLHQPGVLPVIREAISDGVFRGAEAGLFTNAYFHLPHELATEIEAAGFEEAKVFNVEGPGFLVDNFEERWADAARRQALIEAARIIESHPDMVAAASHLLAVARLGR